MDTFSICACHPCAGAMLVCGHVRSVGPRLGPQARNLRLLFLFRLCFSCAFARSSGPPLTPAEQGRPPLGWPPVSSTGLLTRGDMVGMARCMADVEWQKVDTFSIYACHPCAGAMLIFSVSFPILTVDSRGSTEGQWQLAQ